MAFKYFMVRVMVYLLGLGAMLSFGLLLYLLAPISSYYLFGNFNIRKNHRYFIPFAISIWRTVYIWLTDAKYREMFRLPLTTPPQAAPDLNLVELSDAWQREPGDCGSCVRCCLKVQCPLLDKERGLCSSYGSIHWRYFNCGRYPTTQPQIEYYACPKWKLRDRKKEVS